MATSLAQQLRKLRAPQTNILLQDKKRPSLLFDPKEAANLDRAIVLNIGQSGLQDLIKLCPSFGEFENSLFSPSSVSLERSVEDRKVNDRLNAAISNFLIRLSPYFLLNSAHKALEWLIHRFHIHSYNRNEFMMLILPYHETRIFVRALQLLDLSDASDRWNWLEPLQKPGVPLPSLSLVSRFATDNGLLKMLCKHVIEATTVCGERANSLSTLYAFWTMSIVGALEKSASITELQTSHVIACLAKGLSSQVVDFAAGSYMIVAKLCTKASLDETSLNYLLTKTLKHARLDYEATLLVFFVYENASSRLCRVSEKLAQRVSRCPFFVDHVNRIKQSSLVLTKFLVPFFVTCFNVILTKSSNDSEKIRATVVAIFERVCFDDNEIDHVLESIARAEPTEDTCHEATIFLADLYDRLEKLYPARFDAHLKKLMMTSVDSSASKATLHFLMSWHTGARNAKDSLDILDRLNHPSAEQRIAALEIIARGEIAITENFRDTVNRALIARFSDDDHRVVRSLLEFPRERLKSLFPCDTLVDELMILLAQCNSRKRSGLAQLAIKLLLDVCEDADDTSIFIATLPYLFPSKDHEVEIATSILRSDYSSKNRYMKMVRADAGEEPNAEAVGSAAFHNILKWELLPPTANILGTMKFQSCRGDATSMLFNLVLLGSVCRVPVGSLPYDVALEVIEIADEMTKNHPRVKPLDSCNQINAERISEALVLTSQGILPLQAFTYVIEMVHRRVDIKTNPRVDVEKDQARTRLISRLLEILLEGMSHETRRSHFSWCLKIFFQRHFASAREMLIFLSQFFTATASPRMSLHCIKIAMDLLDNTRSYAWIFSDDVFASNLLIALGRANVACRQAAVELMVRITRTFNISMPGHSTLLHELATRRAELAMDPDQLSLALYNLLSPDPDVTASLKRDVRANLEKSRASLLARVTDETTPVHTVAQLLEILAHVNGAEILRQLAPLGLRLHRELIDSQDRREYSAVALLNVLQRFNSTSVEALADQTVVELFDSAMSDHRPRLPIDETGNEASSSTIVVRQIDETFYERAGKASPKLQKKIIAKLVDVVTDCEIGSVVAACNRAVRRIRIDARYVVEELRAMRDARVPEVDETTRRVKRRSRIQLPRPEVVETRDWKRGITLLEFVQRAENIEHEEALVPMLFDILRVTLSFEIQSPLEYANQLVLSTIYHLATKSCPIKEAHLHIDLIAQCIRISHNPQTHHHALLVLVELFRIANVEAALHSIMPIFTFMGSSVLRQDDAYSIQIISKTIETVVPIVNAANDETHACEIIRVFVVSLPHIPEHRRIPIFVKLLQLLDKHLHLFFLVTFDAHVMASVKPEVGSTGRSNNSERLEFALTIAREFSHSRILEVCLKILRFVRSLPVEVDEDEARRRKFEFSDKHVFDVANNSPKQLRHYKYTVVQFLIALLTSPSLVNGLARKERELRDVEKLYDGLIVEVVILVESATKSADLHQAKLKGKYWKILLHNLYDILDAVNNLLPNRIFVLTVVRLVEHDLLSVRKKALELLNARLQQRKFEEEDHEALLTVVQSLRDIVARKGKVLSPELEIIQQTGLISLKLMARLLAPDHPAHFKPVLDLTTELMKTKDGPLLASSVLCVAELCASMKTHAIQSLNKFVPAIIRLLRTHCHQESPNVVVVGIVSALQKIVESVGNFLSLYLDQLLLELTRLRSLYTDTEHPKIGLIVSRLRATTEKLASCIPMRVLLPAISKTYDLMLASGTYTCIAPLMSVLADSFAHVPPNELQASIPDLATFFLGVLQFREEAKIVGDNVTMEVDEEEQAETSETRNEVVARVEESASQALVALVLKLSEATFRPLYYKLYDWAARYPEMKHRNITFYRLSANIAEHLKSLFVLFAGHFLAHAASLLRANNSLMPEEATDLRLAEESDRLELVEAILLTLHRVFSYDAHNFVNQERFESLAQPIVDQLENTTGTREDYDSRSKDLVVPCVASFASATQDDSLHKQLVYQVLLKTRHARPCVRSAALAALIEIARKLGEDFMPLLPETVPFLAELLEDEDEGTEKRAQNAVRTLEEILGEPLQKYF